MKKLKALVEFLIKQLNFVAAENISSFHIPEQFKPVGYPVTDDIICLYDQLYTAVINIERFPVRHQPELVFGLLSSWLLKNDPYFARFKIDRANNQLVPLANPDINLVEVDDHVVNLELMIPFREPVFAVLDPSGILEFDGLFYRLPLDGEISKDFIETYIFNVDYDDKNYRRYCTG
jgi:hypothetical protein